jgi:hypothetical protein
MRQIGLTIPTDSSLSGRGSVCWLCGPSRQLLGCSDWTLNACSTLRWEGVGLISHYCAKFIFSESRSSCRACSPSSPPDTCVRTRAFSPCYGGSIPGNIFGSPYSKLSSSRRPPLCVRRSKRGTVPGPAPDSRDSVGGGLWPNRLYSDGRAHPDKPCIGGTRSGACAAGRWSRAMSSWCPLGRRVAFVLGIEAAPDGLVGFDLQADHLVMPPRLDV